MFQARTVWVFQEEKRPQRKQVRSGSTASGVLQPALAEGVADDLGSGFELQFLH